MASKVPYSAIYSSKAQKNIAEQWSFYEDRQQGLGDRFVQAVRNRVHLIEQHPERYPTRTKTYKETPVPDFPFLIIYRVNNKKKLVRIVSVFNTYLNPVKKY